MKKTSYQTGSPGSTRRLPGCRALAAAAGPAAALLLLAAACGGPTVFRGFRTSDGIGIAADLHVPPGAAGPAPLVVLAHQLYRDRTSWNPLVPGLLDAGYAVLAVDRRGFGESTAEVASVTEVRGSVLANFHLDLLEGIAAVRGRPGVDASRVAIVASGMSNASAVKTARLDPSVRSLVLMSGLIPEEEEEFLLEHPDFPLLLVAAVADDRGVHLMRQYARRLTGRAQEYLELPADRPSGREGWEGTDALRDETGLSEYVLWFLERTFVSGS